MQAFAHGLKYRNRLFATQLHDRPAAFLRDLGQLRIGIHRHIEYILLRKKVQPRIIAVAIRQRVIQDEKRQLHV